MAGDLWHLAGALALDSNTQLQCVRSETFSGQDPLTDADKKVLRRFGGIANLSKHARKNPGTGVVLDEGETAPRGTVVTWQDAVDYSVKSPITSPAPNKKPPLKTRLVGDTLSSTSIIVENARRNAKQTRCQLNKAFINNPATTRRDNSRNKLLSNSVFALRVDYINHIYKEVANIQANKLLFVNMRFATGNQNLQHNITPGLLDQIIQAANQVNAQVVRVGLPENKDSLNFNSQDLTAHNALVTKIRNLSNSSLKDSVDIYAERKNANNDYLNEAIFNAMFAEKTFQPLFWVALIDACKDAKKEIVGLIGGRSGGMDIAAWVGMRTACYDRVNHEDQHYLRLHWAASYTSILRLLSNPRRLDTDALNYWVGGKDILPTLPDDPKGPSKDVFINAPSKIGTAERRYATKKVNGRRMPVEWQFYFPFS